MADFSRVFPNEDANNNLTSTGLVNVGFGFNASYVRLENLGAGAAFVSIHTTSGATTGSHRLSSGQVVELKEYGTQTAGFSAAATSTGNILNYGAWG